MRVRFRGKRGKPDKCPEHTTHAKEKGRKGEAHAYLTKDDIKANGRVLVAILRDAGQEVPAELAELTSRAGGKGGGKGRGGRGRGRGFGRGRGRGGGFGKGQKRKW